jgi:hypothetical protein
MSTNENSIADTAPVINKELASNKPRIPLAEAINRASNWRDMIGQIPVGDSANPLKKSMPSQRIFRAISINITDVKDLLEDHPDAKAIRLYLSLQNPDFPYQITGMLVPVDVNNHDMLTKKTVSNGTMDVEEILKSADSSTIYDFTQPCPSLCDTASPMFNTTNSIQNYI